MVILAALWASASPLDDLSPLPACEPGMGAQVVFPNLVFDLAFDAQGRLWVADWSGVTVHGPNLGVLERPAPGTHGWVGLHPDDEGGFIADNVVGLSVPAVRLHDDKYAQSYDLSEFFKDPEQPHLNLPLGIDLGKLSKRPNEPHATLEEAGYALSKNGVTFEGTPFAEADVPYGPDLVTSPEAAALQRLRFSRLTPPRGSEARAIAVAEDGRVASATRSHLSLRDADGDLLAQLPLYQYTHAVGVVRDRPFTVEQARLRVWSADLSAHWQATGQWTSAVEHDGNLLATDPAGRVWSIDLDTGETSPRACLVDDCDREPGRLQRPPHADDATTLGPLVMAWNESLRDQEDAARPARIELHSVHGHLVAAHLDNDHTSLHAIRALTVLSQDGTETLATRELEKPLIADVMQGSDGTVVLRLESLAETGFTLPELEPTTSGLEGPGVFVTRMTSDSSRVSIGAYENGRFQPAAGLPPRHGYQLRPDAWGTFDDERFALSSRYAYRGRDSAPGGATEIWCRPPQDGPNATVHPGLLGISHPNEKTPSTRLSSKQKQLDREVSRAPTPLAPPTVWPWWADVTTEPTWVWVESGTALDPAVASLPLKTLRVLSTNPAPADLPVGVTWAKADHFQPSGLLLVQHGVVVWRGTPDAFHPVLQRTSGKKREVTEEMTTRWAAQLEQAPKTLQPPRPQELFDRAVAEQDVEAARAMLDLTPQGRARGIRATPEQLTQLFAGSAVPDITWETAPSSDTYVLGIGTMPDDVWRAADEAGMDGAVVGAPARGAVAGLAIGTSKELLARFGKVLVVVRDGKVVTVLRNGAPASALRDAGVP
jgi:hypothetical protein